MRYGVKIVYTYTVGKSSRKFYEESVLSINAESFDEAYEKAETYASKGLDEHLNPHGETVKAEKFELIDCFVAMDEEDEVYEIYSAFKNNKTSLEESKFYEALTAQCDVEELYDLRYKEFNKN